MRTLSAKLALLAIVLAGFVCTGDLPRLLQRGSEAIDAAAAVPGGAAPPGPSQRAPGETAPQTQRAPGETAPQTQRAPGETAPQTQRAPGETGGRHTVGTRDPIGRSETPARAPSAVGFGAGETVPLPRMRRGPVTIDSLRPGDRLLVRVGGELVAFDTIDAATGEAIEHRHVVRVDGTVHVSAREAPRRVRIGAAGGTLAAGGILRVEASAGSRTLGPIIAIGVEQDAPVRTADEEDQERSSGDRPAAGAP